MNQPEPKIKNCSKCGASFECTHNADCWCMSYSISPENLKKLQQTYADCLCPDCLKEFSDGKKEK